MTTPRYTITLPDQYVKQPLPGLDKWLTALRSGRYKQTRGRLFSNACGTPAYCCLGVLGLTQSRINGLDIVTDNNPDDNGTKLSWNYPLFPTLGLEGEFPHAVSVQCPSLHVKVTSFVSLNDVLHLTFTEIADIAEQLYTDEQ